MLALQEYLWLLLSARSWPSHSAATSLVSSDIPSDITKIHASFSASFFAMQTIVSQQMAYISGASNTRQRFRNRWVIFQELRILAQNMEHIIVYGCPLQYLPAEVVKLNNLVTLSVERCPLSELPLKKVVEGETAVTELSRLEYLLLWGTRVSEISFIEGVCPTLKHLEIVECDYLVEVGALPPTLTKLSLQRCARLRKMEGLWNLTNLQQLHISKCREVEELPGLERLISLEVFRADVCSNLKRIGGVGQQTELRRISVSSCVALEEIASVEDLRSLEELNIANCPKLQLGVRVLEMLRQRLKVLKE